MREHRAVAHTTKETKRKVDSKEKLPTMEAECSEILRSFVSNTSVEILADTNLTEKKRVTFEERTEVIEGRIEYGKQQLLTKQYEQNNLSGDSEESGSERDSVMSDGYIANQNTILAETNSENQTKNYIEFLHWGHMMMKMVKIEEERNLRS